MSPEAVTALAIVLAGAVGMPLIEGIKRLVEATGNKLDGIPALYTTAGVSVILSGFAMWISGAFARPFSWELVGGAIASVFSIATFVYKHLADKLNAAREVREYKRSLLDYRPPFTEQ